MIVVNSIEYHQSDDITVFTATFTHEDYQQIHEAGADGDLTEQQIIDMLQLEHDQWIERIS